MQKTNRTVRGQASFRRGLGAEFLALGYLMLKGYWPCAMRFRPSNNPGRGEIDLILRRGKLFVAVEVKARPDQTLGHEAMTAPDWQRRSKAMADFMQRGRHKNCSVRFDLVVVNPYLRLTHIESAWQPEFSPYSSSA